MKNTLKEYKHRWYLANRERTKVAGKLRYEKNKAWIMKRSAAYIAANPEKSRQIQARYRKKNRAYYVAKCAERYAKKTMSTPAWANEIAIGEYYSFARIKSQLTGKKYHVDHIVPLRSKIVCGLHTDYNLQVLPAFSNQSKNNRHWPDMPT